MDTKSFDQQLPVYEHYSRSMGYIAVAAVLVAGYLSGVWQAFTPLIVVCVLIYPHLIHSISKRFIETKHKERRFVMILIDAMLLGVLLPYIHFSLLPSLLFLIMINTSFLVVGSLTGWLICLLSMAVGVAIGSWMFGFSFLYEVPIQVSITTALGVGIHLAVTGYYSHKQAKQLATLHHELKKQQAESRNLSLKVAKYISPQIWESIFSGKKEVKLETQRKKLVIFFSDIKGFTSLSEELDADVLTEMLNQYLTEMSRITLKYGGTIDKFIGDSIMVFFGDPTTQGAKRDALACVAMALEMRKYMKVLRQHWRANGIQTPLEIRMGINTGYCTVGNFGTESRMDYTIIGREVNMASRLESAAESGEILISHETFSLVQDKIMCREKGSITVKGFSRPVPVYQVVDFRHNLAANPSFLEHELPGFSMYLDATKITNYDREKVVKMLENAATKLKDKSRLIL
ncbi:MAG: adenylate cyclase [Oceanospirillaceae bacterium]|nr:adenylate cyclase [Oceanospirillaceae bacterium]MCP5334113.1 adenylate cyclase [Oceanospirillaceae bacterium]MCP5351251.1 adenylate cyclase [Oceanospirillaceae bacterium]